VPQDRRGVLLLQSGIGAADGPRFAGERVMA
jgi:hypothetical protein